MSLNEENSLNVGYCEFMTPAEATSKTILAKVAIVAFSAILTLAMLFVTLKTIPVVSFMLLVAIVFMAWFVFQFTKIEYEYTVASATFTLSKIYGARTRKDVLEFKTSDITLITPVEKAPKDKLDSALVTCCKKASDKYLIVFGEHGENAVVISAPQKTISCLKFYRRSAFANM